jgi:L-threonylcarbamoyladenylate synthase
MLDAAAIGAVLGYTPEFGGQHDAPRVSGSLAAHYAPRTPLQLVAPTELAATVLAGLGAGQRIAVLAAQQLAFSHEHLFCHAASSDPARFAHELYARLREIDALGCDIILVAAPPGDEAWRAVADRLGRAAAATAVPRQVPRR